MRGTTGEHTNAVAWPLPFWSTLKGLLGKVCIHRRLRALRIEETLPLGEKRFLALVRWNDETLLVGVTPQNITLLQPDTLNRAYRSVREQEPAA